MKKINLIVLLIALIVFISIIGGCKKIDDTTTTITFISNGGSDVVAINVSSSDELTAPLPIRAGYEFLGWYEDENITTPFNFQVIPSNDITLYAEWGTAGLEYTLINNEYYVSKGSVGSVTEILIPKAKNGVRVTGIADNGFNNIDTLININITINIEYIGKDAFAGSTNINYDTSNDNLIYLGDWLISVNDKNVYSINFSSNTIGVACNAFSDLTLFSINIPKSVKYINKNAFTGCVTNSFKVNNENNYFKSIDGVLYNINGGELISYPSGKADNIFTIPNDVTKICGYAFSRCEYLESLTIPQSVLYAEENAIYQCANAIVYNLSINKPAGYNTNWADNNPLYWNAVPVLLYNRLQYLIIDDEIIITKILRPSLSDSINRNHINIPSSIDSYPVTSIGSYALTSNNLKSIHIGNNISNIATNAFVNCDNLFIYCEDTDRPSNWDEHWNNSDSVIYWNVDEVFIEGRLEYIIINNQITITRYINYPIIMLDIMHVAIPDSINGINVTSIGIRAFENFDLRSVHIGNNINYIGKAAFKGNNATMIIYCESITANNNWDIDWNTEDYYIYWNIDEVLQLNYLQYLIIDDNIIITNSLKPYPLGSYTNIILPSEIGGKPVSSIGNYAFSKGPVTSIYIPLSVVNIAHNAFHENGHFPIYCEATSKPSGYEDNWDINNPVYWNVNEVFTHLAIQYLIIDNTITITNCLAKIPSISDIPAEIDSIPVTAIGKYAYCNAWKNTLYIPESITDIGDYAFSYSMINNIVIPISIVNMGANVFSGCDFLTIYCEASSKPAGWNADWNIDNRPVLWSTVEVN